jgi:hypothetical protein
MDIKKVINGNIPIPGLNQKRIPEPSGLDFQKLLEKANSNTGLAGPSNAATFSKGVGEIPPDPASVIQTLNFLVESAGVSRVRSLGIKAAENTLNLLEKYQEAIGDPQMTLKKVNGLAESLSQEVDDLNSLSDKLPLSDPLKKIMNEIGIVSMVEVEKFNRGEYI